MRSDMDPKVIAAVKRLVAVDIQTLVIFPHILRAFANRTTKVSFAVVFFVMSFQMLTAIEGGAAAWINTGERRALDGRQYATRSVYVMHRRGDLARSYASSSDF